MFLENKEKKLSSYNNVVALPLGAKTLKNISEIHVYVPALQYTKLLKDFLSDIFLGFRPQVRNS